MAHVARTAAVGLLLAAAAACAPYETASDPSWRQRMASGCSTDASCAELARDANERLARCRARGESCDYEIIDARRASSMADALHKTADKSAPITPVRAPATAVAEQSAPRGATPQAPDLEAWCASDRAQRIATAEADRAAVRAEREEAGRLRAYAAAHCRRITKPTYRDTECADANGYLYACREQDGTVEVWTCPPGAPPGIDGNTEIAVHGDRASVYRGGGVEEKNAQCHDIPPPDAG